MYNNFVTQCCMTSLIVLVIDKNNADNRDLCIIALFCVFLKTTQHKNIMRLRGPTGGPWRIPVYTDLVKTLIRQGHWAGLTIWPPQKRALSSQ